MDIVAIVSVIAGIAAILGFVYLMILGQRSLPEVWGSIVKRNKKQVDNASGSQERDTLKHNLPQVVFGRFVGRQKEIEQIRQLLRPYPESNFHLVSIDGVGGVGKSALALAVAHQFLADASQVNRLPAFDAIVWVSAKESVLSGQDILPRSHSLRTLDDLYRTIASVLGATAINSAAFEERDRLVRVLLSQHRTLLIIDNLETIRDKTIESFLRELPAPTKAIVTTRHRVDVAYPIRLEGLDETNSLLLIEEESRRKGVLLSETESKRLHRLSGGIPLAIVWSIGLLSSGLSANSVLDRLEHANTPISNFCFDYSISQLEGKPSRFILLALSIFTDQATPEATRYVTQITDTVAELEDSLAELEQLSLISHIDNAITLLPLTKQMAFSELRKLPHIQETYLHRYVEYYCELVERILGNDFWGVNVNWRNYPTMDSEVGNVRRAVELAYQRKNWADLLRLTVPLTHYLSTRGLFEDRMQQANLSIEAARKIGKQEILCMMYIAAKGWTHIVRDNLDMAIADIEQGLSLSRMIGFEDGIVLAHAHLARIEYMRANYARAQELLSATDSINATPIIRVRVLLVRALIAIVFKEWERAEECLKQGIELQFYPWPRLQIALGDVYFEQDKLIEAKTAYEEALAVTQQMQKVTERDAAWFGVAKVQAKMGNKAIALESARTSLSYCKLYGQGADAKQIETFISELEHDLGEGNRKPGVISFVKSLFKSLS